MTGSTASPAPVHAFGGEVLKFIGDGVLAIFPVVGATPRGACDAALRAVSAARAGMAHLDEARRREGLPPLRFGAALHLGEMFWGNIGAADRLDFTAIGPAVNLVSRLEGLCRPLGRAVLVSGTFAAETTVSLIPLGTHALRGIASPCAVFTVHRRLMRPLSAPGFPRRFLLRGLLPCGLLFDAFLHRLLPSLARRSFSRFSSWRFSSSQLAFSQPSFSSQSSPMASDRASCGRRAPRFRTRLRSAARRT